MANRQEPEAETKTAPLFASQKDFNRAATLVARTIIDIGNRAERVNTLNPFDLFHRQ
jgi:hypothetical protein